MIMYWLFGFVYIWTGLVVCFAKNQCLSLGDHCRDRTISANGTLHFAVIANLHETSAGKYCGSISTKGFQTAIAIEWITNILSGYIPGITLGFDIFDDCGLPSMATDAILDVLPGGKPADLLSCDDTASKSTFTGVIAMTTVEASMALADVVEPDTPFISGNARSPTLELKDNILFTVPSIKEEVKAAFQLIATLRWYYLVIVHTDEDIGRLYLEEFELQRKETKVCVGGIKQIPIKYTQDVNLVKADVKKLINYLETQQSHTLQEKMGVVYVGGTAAARHIIQSIIDEKSTQARSLQWIMLADIKTDPEVISMIETSAATEDKLDIFLLTVSPHGFVNLNTFRNYFIDRLIAIGDDPDGNYSPWLDKYMAKVYPACLHNCNRVTLEQGFRQDINSVSAVVAVMALASAIKSVHYEHCGNESGVCQALQDKAIHTLVTDKLKSTSIPLDSSSTHLPQELSSLSSSVEIVDRHFHIVGTEMVNFFKYNSSNSRVIFNQIAYLSPHFHVGNNMFSMCKDQCGPCVQEEEVEFGYVDGDVIILGLFSIREPKGDFGCGGYRDDDQAIVTALAFMQTIKQLPLIDGQRIGGLALDDCYSSLNTSHFLTELFSGGRKLKFKTSTSEQIIDMKKVRFAVGAVSSDVTLAVADLLTHLNIPMVSYGASSAFLDNRRVYPYFLRTVPSDKLQVDGIVDVLTHLDFSFVGGIYLDDAYGYNGILDVEKKANDDGICIIDKQMVTGNYQHYPQLEQTLRQNVVKVVVFYGISTVAKEMLENFEDSYIFIASEAWGKDPDLITQQTGPKSRGSLVFQTDTTFHTDNNLQNYLMSISPLNDTGLPWVEHLWESILQCDFPWSIDKKFTNMGPNGCSMNTRINQTHALHLSEYQRVVHISHAINAIWTGCSESPGCMTQAVDRAFAEQLTNAIRNVKLTAKEGTPFKLFKDDGNGYMGLSVFNIQQQDNSYIYKKVGTYSEEGHLNLALDQIKFYGPNGQISDIKATCKPDLCNNICHLAPPANNTTVAPATDRPVTPVPPSTDIAVRADVIVMGVFLGLMFVVLLLLIVLLFRQHATNKEMSTKKTSMHSHHTTSIRSLDNMYEEVGSSRGNSNQGFQMHNFDSRDFSHGSCGDSSSLTTKKTSSIEYSDVVQSLPDLTKPTVPITASSSASGSGGDASSVPSRGSRATEKNSSGLSDTSGPSSLGDRTHLNYVTAKELALVDEDVLATPPPSYLELAGGGEANPFQNSTLQRRLQQAQNRNTFNPPMRSPGNLPINTAEYESKASPENSTMERRLLQAQNLDTSYPIQSPGHAPVPIGTNEVFRPNRPQTLPGISPEHLSNLRFVHAPSTHVQSPSMQPLSAEQQQSMYLHALPQDHQHSTSPHQFIPVSQPASSHVTGQGANPNQLYLLANNQNRESVMYLDPVPQNTNPVHNGGYAPQSSPVVLFDKNGVPHIYTESNLAQYPQDSPVNMAPQHRPIPIKPVTHSPAVNHRAINEPNQTDVSHQSNVPLQYPVHSIGQSNDTRQQRPIPSIISPTVELPRPVPRRSSSSTESGSKYQLSPSYLDDDDGEVIII